MWAIGFSKRFWELLEVLREGGVDTVLGGSQTEEDVPDAL